MPNLGFLALCCLALVAGMYSCAVNTEQSPVERVPERGAKFVGVSDVPLDDEVVQLAVDKVARCLNVSCDLLGSGWSFWYALESDYSYGRFVCEGIVDCEPLPEGCASGEDCPCLCQGVTQWPIMRVIMAPNLCALEHEVIHACIGPSSVNHDGPEWRCLVDRCKR